MRGEGGGRIGVEPKEQREVEQEELGDWQWTEGGEGNKEYKSSGTMRTGTEGIEGRMS